MFFELLPVPVTWLGFYALGQATGRLHLAARCYVIALTSLALLLVVCGIKAWIFYIALGSSVLLAGTLVNATRCTVFHRAVFATSILVVAFVILAFLGLRPYVQKYFVFLPSLSYFGFRGIAYLVSVYRRGSVDPGAGAMQMFFFPVLFMGPITRVEDFEEEARAYDDVLRRLTFGFAMLIAAHFCGKYVLDEVSTSTLLTVPCSRFWLGAFANSFDLYFTFAGYSHLIIGLGLLVGFKLQENFNRPYLATSVSDFWRRWHMSLSYWIRDYIYIPLGGSRHGVGRKCLSLLVAMGVCGIWHGLEWHYVLWGLFHGAVLSSESLMTHLGFRPLQRIFPLAHKPLRIALTFLLVTFSWLLFKYPASKCGLYMMGLFSW